MSPLWSSRKIKQLLTNSYKPSPNYYYHIQSFAQSVFFFPYKKFLQLTRKCDAIKGISLFTSVTRQAEGSMTVEAAVILPLFLCFFLNLGCAIELIRLHSNLEFALCEIGNRMAVYGYALTSADSGAGESNPGESKENGVWSELKDVAFSYIYVKNEIVNYLGEQYLEESPISKGTAGLHFPESEIFTGEDCFEIVATYEVAPFDSIAGFRNFRMANRYYGHLWNGYHIPGTEGAGKSGDVVYVAENGVVYHSDRECSHLLLSVKSVSLQEAYTGRNEYGERYTLCMRCKDSGVQGNVYITNEGDNIHYRVDCPGLKRTVNAVAKNDAEKYRACSRCVVK